MMSKIPEGWKRCTCKHAQVQGLHFFLLLLLLLHIIIIIIIIVLKELFGQNYFKSEIFITNQTNIFPFLSNKVSFQEVGHVKAGFLTLDYTKS